MAPKRRTKRKKDAKKPESSSTKAAKRRRTTPQDQEEKVSSVETSVKGYWKSFSEGLFAPDTAPSSNEVAVVTFLLDTLSRLQEEETRSAIAPLFSLPLWTCLSDGLRNQILTRFPALKRHYTRMLAKGVEEIDAQFLPTMLVFFIHVLRRAPEADGASHSADASAVSFIASFLELLCDLLSQLPTRRFVVALLKDMQLGPCLIQSPQIKALPPSARRRVQRLVDGYLTLENFEIDDHSGVPLSPAQVKQLKLDKVGALQRVVYKHYRSEGTVAEDLQPAIDKLVFTSAERLSRRDNLGQLANQIGSPLTIDILQKVHVLPKAIGDSRWHKHIQGWMEDEEFVTEVLLYHACQRQSLLQRISETPVFPTETMLYSRLHDQPALEDDSDQRESRVKPLNFPKLGVNYLTIHDYLMRNYVLYQLEASFAIREDVTDVVRRMQAAQSFDGSLKFNGWARMAVPLKGGALKVTKVKPPRLGEAVPAEVFARLEVDLTNVDAKIRAEWEELRQHDVLFLLSLKAPVLNEGETKADSEHEDECDIQLKSLGIRAVRGCTIRHVGEDSEQNPEKRTMGLKRVFIVTLDAAQYAMDQKEKPSRDPYSECNLLMRRHAKENNFKAVLETIRDIMVRNSRQVQMARANADSRDPQSAEQGVLPNWLTQVFLGYSEAAESASTEQNSDGDSNMRFGETVENLHKELRDPFPPPQQRTKKSLTFTPTQSAAIRGGMKNGLTLIQGPPGTGKTDVAVQLALCLYHKHPNERILLVTHSNAALNDIFAKLALCDIDGRHMLRLGSGFRDLQAEMSSAEMDVEGGYDFSTYGRVSFILKKRQEILSKVLHLANSLGLNGEGASASCETALYFKLYHVTSRVEKFRTGEGEFPFKKFFSDLGVDVEDADRAELCLKYLEDMFDELESARAFEVLRTHRNRSEYLLLKQARIIAMTVTHAALNRRRLIDLDHKYDTVIMEEAGQVMDIEAFITLTLQEQALGESHRLKRVVLVGDHEQLPPIVSHPGLRGPHGLEQSMFHRFRHAKVPFFCLDAQGRARPELAALYSWRYPRLDSLPHTVGHPANVGMRHTMQLIAVEGQERTPTPHFIQNLSEAEWTVQLFLYLVAVGHPPQSIALLSPYRGQQALLTDVLRSRYDLRRGAPSVETVDSFQGQQADIVLLSLTRTKHVGHVRDLRRLTVAVSRAKLGLYVFANVELFLKTDEIKPILHQFIADDRGTQLQLVFGEKYGSVTRGSSEEPETPAHTVVTLGEFASIVHHIQGVQQNEEGDKEDDDEEEEDNP